MLDMMPAPRPADQGELARELDPEAVAALDRAGLPEAAPRDRTARTPAAPTRKGRGAAVNPPNRFEPTATAPFDDGWSTLDADLAELPPLPTTLTRDASRSVISYNQSPDLGFDRAVNPYRGCEHGCVYCYARPSHAYLGYSPGLDFETRLLFKPDVAELLETRAAQARLRRAAARARLQHRSLPAGRADAEADARRAGGAGTLRPSGQHRHQVRRRAARPRHPAGTGAAAAGARVAVGDDAGRRTGAPDGAARGDAAAAVAGGDGAERGRRAGRRAGRADDPRPERRGTGAHPGGIRRRRCRHRRLRPAAAAARDQADLRGLAGAPLSAARAGTCWNWCAPRGPAPSTIPASASGCAAPAPMPNCSPAASPARPGSSGWRGGWNSTARPSPRRRCRRGLAEAQLSLF